MEAESSTAFCYSTLDRSKREIRLLRFDLSNCTNGTISCMLQTVEMHNDLGSGKHHTPYIALSYTWTPNYPVHTISLNKQTFTVGESLYTALQILLQVADGRLGHYFTDEGVLQSGILKAERSFFFWIDAICINQNSDAERSHQVSMMAEIYTNATSVIGWLGPPTSDSPLAIRSIRESVYSSEEARMAIGFLAIRKYWNRMWVAQEFVLAKKLLVLCGPDGFWWDDVPNMNQSLAGYNSTILMLWDKRKTRQLAQKYDGYRLSLDELIEDMRDRECANRLDKVYALLGLVYPPMKQTEMLYTDYEITSEKLYYRVLSHLRKYGFHRKWGHQWMKFRLDLRMSLDLSQNDNHEFLYNITDEKLRYLANPSSQDNLSRELPDDILCNFARALYEEFRSDLESRPCDTLGLVQYLESQFSSFPQHEDPYTWKIFRDMLQDSYRLGLLGPDSCMNYPSVNVAGEHGTNTGDDKFSDIKEPMIKHGQGLGTRRVENIDAILQRSRGDEPILWVASKGHESVVKQLLEEGANIEARDQHGWTPLHLAAAQGQEAIVKQLLKKGANIKAQGQDNWTPLHLAAIQGYEAIVKQLLEEGADNNTQDQASWTPLHFAVNYKYEAVIDRLLEKGPNINTRDQDGYTPLHLVTSLGFEAIIKKLLDNRANIETQTNNGWTPLHIAAIKGYKSIIKQLLENGANIEARDQVRWTPLHWAVNKGHEVIVKLLLEKGANISALDHNGWTPLHLAANQGYNSIVTILLAEDADIESQSQDGWTPLHRAAGEGYIAIVKQLLDRGANIEAQDRDGWTPLHLASEEGYEATVIQLLEEGADIEARDQVRWTPLHFSAEQGHEAIIQHLLEKGANIKARDQDGWTPLHLAAAQGYDNIVIQLLEKGANIEAQSENGWTPLYRAAKEGYEAIVKQLLDKGADIDARDQDSWTPLHLAAGEGCEAIVKQLLEEGANINAQDQNGWTALHFAANQGREGTIKQLLEKGANIKAQDRDGWTSRQLAADQGYEAVVKQLDTPRENGEGWLPY